jgi:hypothetical protein
LEQFSGRHLWRKAQRFKRLLALEILGAPGSIGGYNVLQPVPDKDRDFRRLSSTRAINMAANHSTEFGLFVYSLSGDRILQTKARFKTPLGSEA